MLNFNEATLCECCECNPGTHNPTTEEKCTNILDKCILKYCNFDTVLHNEPSVDCIRITKQNRLVLVEIKNQPTANIDKEVLQRKIEATTRYLLNNEHQLTNLKRIFLLSIPEQKQPKRTNNRQSQYYIKIGNFLAHKRVSIFNNRIYRYKINEHTYSVFSTIALCSDLDELCK